MHANRSLPLLAGLALTTLALAEPLTVTFENLSPPDGAWVTPVWVGFHDGGFDLYDDGFEASMAVERYAEDGDGSHLQTAFDAYGGGQASATLVADSGIPPLAPGETATLTIDVDGSMADGRYLSFFAMVLPSNDAFVANADPMAFPVFDGGGMALPLSHVVPGAHVRDAGTEVNDELPAHTAFFGQAAPNTGLTESGVVGVHPGFLSVGSGGILDDPMFAAADFKASGYELLRVSVRGESTAAASDLPGAFALSEAYPNPFNPSTTIAFALQRTADARLTVHNLAGQTVATLVDGLTGAGEHRVVFDASRLSSGVYFAALRSEGAVQTRKLVLVK